MPAERAGAILADQQTAGRKADALHQHFAALRAIGVLRRMAGHVADVDVVKSLGVGDRPWRAPAWAPA